MTRRRLLLLSLFFLAECHVAILACSERLFPGTYHGYYAVTRWGQKVFHHGPYHLFVSDSAAQQLEKYRGKPLEMAVSRLSQTNSDDAGLIEEVTQVSENGMAMGLVLTAKIKSNEVLQRQGIHMHLSLRNDSEEAIRIFPGSLAIVLVTNSPFSNKDIGYEDPDGCGYWYYRHDIYHPFDKNKKSFQIACREIRLPWTGEDLVSRGHGVRMAEKDRGFEGPIVIDPEGGFESDYVAGEELLPDDYEVFFYLTSGDFSNVPGPMSERLSFDVIQPKQDAKNIKSGIQGGGR